MMNTIVGFRRSFLLLAGASVALSGCASLNNKEKGGIIGAGGELSWPRPTRATDVLHVVSEVVQVQPSKSRPNRGMVTVRSETRNQHGDVLQVSTVRIVVPRRPGQGG